MRLFASEKGSALALTMIIIAIVLVLGGSMLFALESETRTEYQAELHARASYLAQAGLEHGLKLMEGLSLDQVPAYPTNPIRVIESGGRVEEYQITMTQHQVESVGRITDNGSILAQSTIKASWDSTGVVTITP